MEFKLRIFSKSNKSENFVMIRLADIYLMAGEAENELNGPDEIQLNPNLLNTDPTNNGYR